jgi:Arc/MetJ-type ribon-helix-helix transcriptional regulator
MTEVVVRLPDEARSFVEQQVAARRLASASDFLVSLVEEARRRAVVADVDQKLLEGLASGPGEEATPEWWDKTTEEWRQSRPGAPTP